MRAKVRHFDFQLLWKYEFFIEENADKVFVLKMKEDYEVNEMDMEDFQEKREIKVKHYGYKLPIKTK